MSSTIELGTSGPLTRPRSRLKEQYRHVLDSDHRRLQGHRPSHRRGTGRTRSPCGRHRA
ncbi:hypothetical protein SGPA1_41216 [Streptomyces misionensis JCM 4497]